MERLRGLMNECVWAYERATGGIIQPQLPAVIAVFMLIRRMR